MGSRLVSLVVLLAATTLMSSTVWADDDDTYTLSADQLDSDWNHEVGEITTRFGIDFTAATSLGGDDGIQIADTLMMGLNAGAGYFALDWLSADLDLSGTLSFAESGIDFSNFAITPGTHIYPISEVFVRLGVPFVVTDPSSINILGGVGYEYPINDSQTLVGELDLVYPLTGDGGGTITIGGGTTYSF